MTTSRIDKSHPPGNFLQWCLRLVLAVGLFMSMGQVGKAGHGAGVDITYECINSCTIRVHFRAFRSCGISTIQNISPVNTLTFNTTVANCIMPTQVSPWVNVSNQEVTPVCPGTPTRCTSPGSAIDGIVEHYWVGDFDFCSANCTEYNLNWGLCCRNQSITSISNPNATTMFVGTTIDLSTQPCNSSPVFQNPPILYICQGQSHTFLQQASDPDGDSLVYFLSPCLSAPGNPVNYIAGFGPNFPLGPDWIVQLNPITGEINIDPNPFTPGGGSIQTAPLCIAVEEWRNGQLIGTTTRDVQLNVVPCAGNDLPVIVGASDPVGGSANGFTVSTCLGSSICFDIKTTDTDPGQTHILTWDSSLTHLGATFTESGNPSVQDTIIGPTPTGEFCWTPSIAGTFSFVVTVLDDHCPLPGRNQYTFTVEVEQIQIMTSDSALGCDRAAFLATPLTGTAPYNYQWNIQGFPAQTDSSFTQNLPGIGQYPYTLSVTDSAGCVFELNDTIYLNNNVQADPGLSQSVCEGQTLQLGGPLSSNPNLVYQWSPDTAFADPNLPQPVLTINNLSGQTEIQTFVLTVTDTLTTCTDIDSIQLQVNPLPDASFFLPTEACEGDSVLIYYTGNLNGSGSFQWTFNGGSPSSATGQGAHQVLWNGSGTETVSLVVTSLGCSSPPEIDSLFIKPRPVASIAPSPDQCFTGHNFNLLNLGIYDTTATFLWLPSQGASYLTNTDENFDNLTFSNPGTHRVSLTIVQNGCTSNVDTTFLNIIPDPDPAWTFTTTGQCFPLNDFQFMATGQNDPSAIYTWSFQDGNPSTGTGPVQTVNFTSQGAKVVTLTVQQNGCSLSRTDTVFVYPSPEVDAGNPVAFCEGSQGGLVSGTVIGGQGPYTWNWFVTGSTQLTIDSLDDDDPHIMLDSSAWVYAVATDQNGCTSTPDSVWVTILPRPVAIAPNDTFRCEGSAPCIVLIPTVSNTGGPYTYSWSPAAGLNDSTLLFPCASPDSTTQYSFVATDQSTGCRSDLGGIDSSSIMTVEVLPSPAAQAGFSENLCFGDSVQLNGAGAGAGPGYSYSWSPTTGLSNPNIANPVASPDLTTIYSLQVSSNGCTGAQDTMQIRVHAQPSANAGSDIIICLGESTQLNATAGGGDTSATFTFHWGNESTLDNPLLENPTATPDSTTTYSVIATNNWGCESLPDSVTVFLHPTPIAEAGDSAFICLGNPFQFQGSISYGLTDTVPNPSLINYLWTPQQEIPQPNQLQPTFNPTTSGWYQLSVSYQSCQTEDSVYLTVIPHLNAAALVDTAAVCAGDSVQLLASGGFGAPVYQWVPNLGLSANDIAQPMAAPDSTTTYQVYLAEAGCLDSTTVTVEILPRPEASFGHTEAIGCPPHGIFLSSTTPGDAFLSWQLGDGSPARNDSEFDHIYTEPGNYSVQLIATAQGGCADSAELLVQVTPPPRMNISSNPNLPVQLYLSTQGGEELQLWEDLGEVVEWQWDFGNGDRLGGPVVSYTYEEEGTYYVQLRGRDEKGCWSETTVGPILVEAMNLTLFNVISPNGDGINDVFLVPYEGHQPFHLVIYDRWGVTVFETRSKTEGWDGTNLNGKPVPEGAYYYVVRAGQKKFTEQLTVVR